MRKILIIGANGQLGTELTIKLRELEGVENVIAADLREKAGIHIEEGPYVQLDILDRESYRSVIKRFGITEVYHLAAMLSAKGEENPQYAWRLNMESLLTVLESGRSQIKKIYWPSSIAVFGPDTPKQNTPQETIMNPNTVYGISKQAGERWCAYYHQNYKVDVRSLRYPGLIGYKAQPGGGTTDYAVDIFHKAVANEMFSCFLSADSRLPMMYMDDAVEATLKLMNAPANDVVVRSSYNIAAISFTPAELTEEIRKIYPDFKVQYAPDFRQQIANSWPDSIDDSQARRDWGWQNKYDLKLLVQNMLLHLKEQIVYD